MNPYVRVLEPKLRLSLVASSVDGGAYGAEWGRASGDSRAAFRRCGRADSAIAPRGRLQLRRVRRGDRPRAWVHFGARARSRCSDAHYAGPRRRRARAVRRRPRDRRRAPRAPVRAHPPIARRRHASLAARCGGDRSSPDGSRSGSGNRGARPRGPGSGRRPRSRAVATPSPSPPPPRVLHPLPVTAPSLPAALLPLAAVAPLAGCSSLTRPIHLTVAAEPLPSRAAEAGQSGSGHVVRQRTACP